MVDIGFYNEHMVTFIPKFRVYDERGTYQLLEILKVSHCAVSFVSRVVVEGAKTRGKQIGQNIDH